jgi:hypothetical protein
MPDLKSLLVTLLCAAGACLGGGILRMPSRLTIVKQ